jgi:hypothetical protein
MASAIEASGEMQTGSGVMTSPAFMGNLLVRLNVSMPPAIGSSRAVCRQIRVRRPPSRPELFHQLQQV